MPRTHYFPADRVHFTWDTGHEPVLASTTATRSWSRRAT